jgi:hypothetical protein
MTSDAIRKVIEEAFPTPRRGWSSDTLQALASWEIALQLAVANERAAIAAAHPNNFVTFPSVWTTPPNTVPTPFPYTAPTISGPTTAGPLPVISGTLTFDHTQQVPVTKTTTVSR